MNKYTIVYKVFIKKSILEDFLYYGVAYIEAASSEFAEAKFILSFNKKFIINIESISRMR